MADYQAYEWSTGEVISADKLNHMENGIKNAKGYTCTPSGTAILEENVTTEDQGDGICRGVFTNTDFIDSDVIQVTFDGTDYICDKKVIDGLNAYGGIGENGFDYSKIPFYIASMNGQGNVIFTPDEGTYSVKVENASVSTEVSFDAAVKSVDIYKGYTCIKGSGPAIVSTYVETVAGSPSANVKIETDLVIDYDEIYVYFNDEEYHCKRVDVQGTYRYGGTLDPNDFSEYPFVFVYDNGLYLYTESAMECSFEINKASYHTTASTAFKEAVKSIAGSVFFKIDPNDTPALSCDYLPVEVVNMPDASAPLFFLYVFAERKAMYLEDRYVEEQPYGQVLRLNFSSYEYGATQITKTVYSISGDINTNVWTYTTNTYNIAITS